MEKQIKKCSFCGAKDYSEGGNEIIIEHHIIGRNREESEKEKINYCNAHHNIAECRGYINLPFTDYQITGKLFDFYSKYKNIDYIKELIEKKEYKMYWKKIT